MVPQALFVSSVIYFQFFIKLFNIFDEFSCSTVVLCVYSHIYMGGVRKLMCGVTTTKNGPVGPTHPPVTTAVELRQPLVTRQPHPYVEIFIYSDRGRRIRSKYVFFHMRTCLESSAGTKNCPRAGIFFFEKSHIVFFVFQRHFSSESVLFKCCLLSFSRCFSCVRHTKPMLIPARAEFRSGFQWSAHRDKCGAPN